MINFNDSSLIRLAHYVPFEDIDLSSETKNDLVLNALFIEDSALTSTELVEKINTHLGCKLDVQTVEKSLKTLVDSNLVSKTSDKFNLSYDCYVKMKEKVTELGAFQEEVLSDWINEHIRPQVGEIDDDEIRNLKDQLIQFLSELFLQHGAVSKALLENNEALTNDIPSVHKIIEGLDFCSQSLQEIAQREFPLFLSSTNANIRRYLEQLIEKAFRYLTTVCDPSILENIKNSINNKVIYLDSNTVYRLLNLQGERRYNLIKDVVSLCQEFGIRLKVSMMTLKELERRISFDSRVLLEYPTPISLSAVGYKYMTEENFVSTYWMVAKRHGVSIDDFISKYRNVDILLEEEGIEVERELPEHTQEFNEEWTTLIGKINLRDDHEKSAYAVEHDAYLMSLMLELRKNRIVTRFLDSPAWILTTDHFFIRFQSTEERFKRQLPVALLPTQLIQILRFVKPADNKFNEMFLDVFSRAFVPLSDGLSNMHIQKILSRISHYKGSTPYLAEKVLSDQYFRIRYKNSVSDEEKEELIHESLVEKAGELEVLIKEKDSKLQELENRLNEYVDRQEDLLEKIGEKDTAILAITKQLEESKKEAGIAAESAQTLSEQLIRSNNMLENLKNQLEQLMARDAEKEKRHKKQVALLKKILAVVVYVCIASILMYFWFHVSNKIVKASILTTITVLFGLLLYYLVNNKKIAFFVASMSSAIATIFGLYYTLLN